MAVVNSDCTRSRHKFNTPKKHKSLLPSHSSPDTHLCSKYLTYSQLGLANRKKKKSPTQRSLAGFAVEALMRKEKKKKKKIVTAEFRCLLNRLYSSDVFKRRQTEKEALTCFSEHLFMVKWMLCSLHLCVVIFDILAIHHSTYTVCILTSLFPPLDTQLVCMWLLFYWTPNVTFNNTTFFPRLFSGRCFCCAQCHFNSLSLCFNNAGSFLTLLSCSDNWRTEREI